MTTVEDRWYWDRRTNKAYRPVADDGETVTFVTMRHREEVADAIDRDALVPVEEFGLDEPVFELVDSFRVPDDVPTPEDA